MFTPFSPVSVSPCQGEVCVCQVSVFASMGGQVTAVTVQPPQQPASHQTACSAAGKAGVCVASVYVMTPSTAETSVRDVLFAKAPANRTGQFLHKA